MKRFNIIFRLIIALSLISVPPYRLAAVSEESKQFNNLGMGKYELGEYIEAAESFIRSVETDPSNYLAHYNLACTMSLLRKEYVPREFAERKYASFDIYLDTILNHLQKAAALSERRKTRMLEDPDLRPMWSNLRFHRIAGRTLSRQIDAGIVLPAVSWRVDLASGFSKQDPFPDGTVRFMEDGSFVLELWTVKRSISGSYMLKEGEIIFRPVATALNSAEFLGVLSEQGAVISGLTDEPLIMWNDTAE